MDNLVNIIGRIDLKNKVENIENRDFINLLKKQFDKYIGINMDDVLDNEHSICDLQYVLEDNKKHKTDCSKSVLEDNKKHEKIISMMKKNISDILLYNKNQNAGNKLKQMLRKLDKTMDINGYYFIIARLPYNESNQIKYGRVMLIKFDKDDTKQPESYIIYGVNSDNNNKITSENIQKYILRENIKNKYLTDELYNIYIERAEQNIRARRRQQARIEEEAEAERIREEAEAARIREEAEAERIREEAEAARIREEARHARQREEFKNLFNEPARIRKAKALAALERIKIPERSNIQKIKSNLKQTANIVDNHTKDKKNIIDEINNILKVLNDNNNYPLINYTDINKITSGEIQNKLKGLIDKLKVKKGGKTTRKKTKRKFPKNKMKSKKARSNTRKKRII